MNRETSPVDQKISEEGAGPKQNLEDQTENRETIINNFHLKKVLGGRVFDKNIIHKPGMDSLYDLVEI